MAREQALRKVGPAEEAPGLNHDVDRDHIQQLQRRLAEEEAQREREEAARQTRKGFLSKLLRRRRALVGS